MSIVLHDLLTHGGASRRSNPVIKTMIAMRVGWTTWRTTINIIPIITRIIEEVMMIAIFMGWVFRFNIRTAGKTRGCGNNRTRTYCHGVMGRPWALRGMPYLVVPLKVLGVGVSTWEVIFEFRSVTVMAACFSMA